MHYYREILSRGYRIEKVVRIGDGKAVDLALRNGGNYITIEIEIGKSDVDGNVKKCNEAGFEEVSIVYTKKPHK